MTDSNITDKHRRVFKALLYGGFDNFALFSCFYDGEPTAAIIAVNAGPAENYDLTPLLVFPTKKMLDRLTDNDGNAPEDLNGE